MDDSRWFTHLYPLVLTVFTMKNIDTIYDCLIIGAGISGLAAATEVQEAGFNTLLLDKSRGVGGRMATRRIGDAVLDHGSPFFCLSPAGADTLDQILSSWREEGLLKTIRGAGNKSYHFGANGMNSLAKHIAKDLKVHRQSKVTSLHKDDELWRILLEGGSSYSSRTVVLTPPVPQSLDILKNGGTTLGLESQEKLGSIGYEKCIAILAVLNGNSTLSSERIEFAHPDNPVVHLVVDNKEKGISPNKSAVTIFCRPDFSDINFARDDEYILSHAFSSIDFLLPRQRVHEAQVHRWRYSQAKSTINEPFHVIANDPSLMFCGDGFLNTGISGAFESGQIAGMAMSDYLFHTCSSPYETERLKWFLRL